ncbi:MAG: PAS domain S-box protein, partial [Gammaproteobacteria bacterium]|nr:PAS domain S-box protein [Gammaproteobacteria bacterium]
MTSRQIDTTNMVDNALQTLLDTVQTFIGTLDTDGTVSFSNKAPLTLANLKPEDIYGKKFWDCYWFEHNIEAQALIQDSVLRAAAGETINNEFQITLTEGPMWVSFTLQPVIEAGKIIKLVVEGHDITEKKRLSEEAQVSQRRLQGLFDDMKAMVAILDIEGRVTLANNTPLLVSGLDQADVKGQKLWSCPWFTGDSQSQDAVQEYVNQAAAGHSVQGDILINTLEGRIWLEFSVHPVFDDAGHVTQLVAEGNDPSARRQVEEEREQALVELQTREQNLAVTLDSIGDAVITTDAQGKITRMNPVAEQLTGWTYTEAQNEALQGIFPIFNAATGEPLASPVDKLMATGEIVHMSTHTTLRARNGHDYQISNSAAPIRDQEDRILGAILVFSDISEQYRLREQAKAAQLQLQGLFDDMQTMVGLYSPDGTTTFLNNTPLIASGFTRRDAIGKKLWDTPFFNYSADSQAHVQREMKRAAAGNTTLSDIQFASLSGEKSWIALSFHPVLDDNGKVLQIVGEARDIAERKKTEDNLRASERQLKRYRDQAPLAAIEVDSERRIVGWNAAAEKMFGYSYKEAQNQSIEFILPSNTPNTEVFKTWEKLSSTEADKTLTSKFQHKDGHNFYGQSHNAPFIDESGQVVGAGAIIRDITAERAAQRGLHDSERAQREILDSMVEGVIVTNEMGTILTFNRAAENLLGYRVKDIAGQSV